MARLDTTPPFGPRPGIHRGAPFTPEPGAPASPAQIKAIGDTIAAERKARKDAAYDRFTALFAEWLRSRAQSLLGVDDEEIPFTHSDREDELARLITTTPAAVPWMVLYKLQVLEHYLGDDGTNWTDNRELVMLAGIRADLLRFTLEERS
ncbi:MAG: hypothetical protein PGN25_05665 [Methylorubrum populi]